MAMEEYIIEEDLDLKKLEVEVFDQYGNLKSLSKPKLLVVKRDD